MRGVWRLHLLVQVKAWEVDLFCGIHRSLSPLTLPLQTKNRCVFRDMAVCEAVSLLHWTGAHRSFDVELLADATKTLTPANPGFSKQFTTSQVLERNKTFSAGTTIAHARNIPVAKIPR